MGHGGENYIWHGLIELREKRDKRGLDKKKGGTSRPWQEAVTMVRLVLRASGPAFSQQLSRRAKSRIFSDEVFYEL
jgi:hypothetical protein